MGILYEACPEVAVECAGLGRRHTQFAHLQVVRTAMVNHCLQQLACNPVIALYGSRVSACRRSRFTAMASAG